MSKIKFKIAAKTDVGLERSNNEDNFQAASDLQVAPMKWVNNEVCQLGEKGALLVVADGMGGMNAGEVASQIAIDTVRKEFTPANITPEITKSRYAIEKFMNEVIVKADAMVKDVSKKRPETQGMGTTIVIAWLLENHLYISWCGDSRAYVYNPKIGLHRLSKDHSYVQQLVDDGKLSEDEAFEFPDSNIITRCLSDAKQKAKPECLSNPYPLCDNDIILLCTDGLCGMIRDAEILDIMQSFNSEMTVLADNLVQAALDASGADNCTVCLCQIISGGNNNVGNYFSKLDKQRVDNKDLNTFCEKHKGLLVSILCLFCLCLGGLIMWWILGNSPSKESPYVTQNDSLRQQTDTTIIPTTDVLDKPEESSDNIMVEDDKERSRVLRSQDLNSGLGNISVPKTSPKEGSAISIESATPLTQNSNEIEPDAGQVEDIRNIVSVPLPEGLTIHQFAQKHGMNYREMRELNPNIKNWKSVQPGTHLNVYKK